MKNLHFFLIILINLSCDTRKDNNVIDKIKFDHLAFQADSIGCQKKRELTLEILEKNKDKIIGLSKKEIIRYLGNPNQVFIQDSQVEMLFYFIDCPDDYDLKIDTLIHRKEITTPFFCIMINKKNATLADFYKGVP